MIVDTLSRAHYPYFVKTIGYTRVLAALTFLATIPSSALADIYAPKPLDGVTIEAVETYVNPKSHQFGLGLAIYPFDAYYTGISLDASYTQHFSQNFAWQIVDASYNFAFQTA